MKHNHPFSPSALIEKISKIAPFIEYQIIVETSDRIECYKPLLPGEIHEQIPDFIKHFEVSFNELDKSEGIEGTLRVFQTSKKKNQLIAQRGFSIPPEKLLPHWLYNKILMSINLSGQAKLSLSPNRSNIIEDEKYYKLIGKIQLKLLNELENNLNTYRDSNTLNKYIGYVDKLLEEDILNTRSNYDFGFIYEEDKQKESMKKIFLNNVPLLTASRDGKQSYEIIKDWDRFPTVVITYKSDWPDKIQDENVIKEIECLINPDVIVLLDGNSTINSKKRDFLDEIIGLPSEIYITSIPGVVVETFSSSNDLKIFYVSFFGFTWGMHSKTGTKEPLFVHDPVEMSDPDSVIFNANHQFFYRFIDGTQPRDENSIKALDYIYNTFYDVLNSLTSTVYSRCYMQKIDYSDHKNYMLIGIIKDCPKIIDEFYIAAKEFWENAQNVGAISYDEKFPGFTIEDLPWFWNYNN